MIYIVTGQPAGGTSMMMRVLIEGGIEGIYRKDFENTEQRKRVLDGLHNPYGTFEGDEGTTWEDRDNKCIKVLGTASMPKELKAKVVWIRRNPEHIAQSRYERRIRRSSWNGRKPKPDHPVSPQSCIKRNKHMEDFFPMQSNLDVHEIDFIKMNEDTENEVKRLAKFLEYPNFNIDKAIKAVDKTLYTKRT